MSDLYLIPQPGLVVRDPETGRPLPPEGGVKPRTPYWLRRLREYDVAEGQPPAVPDLSAETPAKPKKGGQ